MRVTMLLADFAQVSDGKLTVVGGGWSLTGPEPVPFGIAILIRALDLFKIFDMVWQLTRGGPGTKTETLSIFMFVKGFQSFETSYTAALVVVLLILLSIVVTIALRRMEIAR